MGTVAQQATGNITMRIDDDGYTVSFWVLTNSQTYNHQQQWSWSDSGVMTFDMNNRGSWQQVGAVGVGGSRNIGWTIYNASLGFPTTTISAYINRATVPGPPSWVDVHPTSASSIYAQFAGGSDGGAAIDTWQIGYGVDPNGPQYFINNWNADIGGLWNSQYWYFWGRGHNSQGWGPWSARASAIPFRTPDPPTVVTPSAPTNNKIHASFRGNWNGGQPVDNWQVGYGTDPNTPQLFWDNANSGEQDITGLLQNTTYYFWARGHNPQGWGGWGARGSLRTQGTPDAPSGIVLTNATQTTIATSFSLNGDNGQPITGQQIGFGTDPNVPQTYTDVALTDILQNLQPGTFYYFWSRAKNAYGWGALSVVKTARTVAGAWVNVNGVQKEAVPYVNVNGQWRVAQAFAKIAGVWKGMQ